MPADTAKGRWKEAQAHGCWGGGRGGAGVESNHFQEREHLGALFCCPVSPVLVKPHSELGLLMSEEVRIGL